MLKVANIGKILGSKRVVRGITINVESGEIVGIMGPNGAGKTSSFYMIAGFIFPDYGSITLNENDITKLTYEKTQLLTELTKFNSKSNQIQNKHDEN